jgi:hypothetical protein
VSFLFFANFAVLSLQGGDAPVQYAWVQNLYGDRAQAWGSVGPGHPIGYFFGLGLLEAPFYGLGKIFEHAGVTRFLGWPIKPAFVCIGTGFVLIACSAILLVKLMRRLQLRFEGFALLTAAFGTSLFFWVVFSPGKNHPADAALFTVVVYLTYRYFNAETRSELLLLAVAAVLGFSITVRYFAGAEAVAFAVVLLYLRRWRHAAILAGATAASSFLLFLIPWGLGTPVFGEGYSPGSAGEIGLHPLSPVRMLFTDHRGLFVWSPICILAVVGLVVLFRRHREQRPFLIAIYAMGLGIMGAYAFVPYWDGVWSFGQRYYTPLFPLVVVGVAAALDACGRRLRPLVVAGAAAATLWSLYLAFNLVVARPQVPAWEAAVPTGATGVAGLPRHQHLSAGEYGWAIYERGRLVPHLIPWPFGGRSTSVGSRALALAGTDAESAARRRTK